jgi:AraC-like DNA-binding protein
MLPYNQLPSGFLYVRPDSLSFLAFGLETRWHATPATAFACSLREPCEVELDGGERITARLLAVAPHVRRRFRAPAGGALIGVLDLSHPSHQGLSPLPPQAGMAMRDEAWLTLRDSIPSPSPQGLPLDFQAAYLATISDLLRHNGWAGAQLDDPLVKAAFGNLSADNPLRLMELLLNLEISASRFAHRFRAATGTSYKSYSKWRRLMSAIQLAVVSPSVTDAALGGQFADIAHYSRAFSGYFGVTPSYLYGGRYFCLSEWMLSGVKRLFQH